MVALNYFLGIGSECPNMLFGKMSENLLSPLENNNGHSDYIHCSDSTFIYARLSHCFWSLLCPSPHASLTPAVTSSQFMQLAPYKNQPEEPSHYSQCQSKLFTLACFDSLILPSPYPNFFIYRLISRVGICQLPSSLAMISSFPS